PLDRKTTAVRAGPRVTVQLQHPDLLLGAGRLAAPASKEARMEQRSQELHLARSTADARAGTAGLLGFTLSTTTTTARSGTRPALPRPNRAGRCGRDRRTASARG